MGWSVRHKFIVAGAVVAVFVMVTMAVALSIDRRLRRRALREEGPPPPFWTSLLLTATGTVLLISLAMLPYVAAWWWVSGDVIRTAILFMGWAVNCLLCWNHHTLVHATSASAAYQRQPKFFDTPAKG